MNALEKVLEEKVCLAVKTSVAEDNLNWDTIWNIYKSKLLFTG